VNRWTDGMHRTRWSAIGAAVAVVIGGGGLLGASASDSDSASVFTAIQPCRIMDTRATSTVGPRPVPLGPGETHSIATFGTNGNCTLPSGLTALALNVTAVGPTADSYLTVFPTGGTAPTASNLNFVANQAPVPNAVTVAVAADGRISFYNNGGNVNVIADVVGYYAGHDHDDRYYTKDQTYTKDEVYSKSESDAQAADVQADVTDLAAAVDAIPPGPLAVSDYAAATYRLTTDGCPGGQARFAVSVEWGAPNTFPDMACVALPTYPNSISVTPITSLTPLVGLPAEAVVEAFLPPTRLLLPNVGAPSNASITSTCSVLALPGTPMVSCSLTPSGMATYPFNTVDLFPGVAGIDSVPVSVQVVNPPAP